MADEPLPNDFETIVEQWVRQDTSKDDFLAFATALWPSVEPARIEALTTESLGRLGHGFKKKAREDAVPADVAKASLLFVFARHNQLPIDPIQTARTLSPAFVDTVGGYLKSLGCTDHRAADILHSIAAARSYIEKNPGSRLSKSRYKSDRAALTKALELQSNSGKASFPVGEITIYKALGGAWNDAVSSIGLATRPRPKGMGLPTYVPEDFEEALQRFLEDSAREGFKPTYAKYEEWADKERESGQAVPVGPSLRNAIGEWSDVLLSASEGALARRARERRAKIEVRDAPELQEAVWATEDTLDLNRQRRALLDVADADDAESRLEVDRNIQLAEAQLAYYVGEAKRRADERSRWSDQVDRWKVIDRNTSRQFWFNTVVVIVIGVATVISPLIAK